MRMMGSAVIASVLLMAAARPAAAQGDVEISRDVVYGHKYGMALTYDVVAPKEGANGAGVLFMVSGGWYSGWTKPEDFHGWYGPLVERGFTAYIVRHGSSPKFVVPEAIQDVRLAVRHVRLNAADHGVDPERLGVTGSSAGGHLSLMLGVASDEGDPKAKQEVGRTTDRVAAVVAYFPPTDLRPMVGKNARLMRQFPALDFEPEKAADCSPIVHVTPDDPPTLLIHGDQDELVNISASRNILKEFEKEKVTAELIVIEGAGHGFRGADNRRAEEARVAWFEKYLAGKKKDSKKE